MPSKMSTEARKILNRWARCELYVYMRPLNSRFVDSSRKPTIYWVVSVEYRNLPPGQWRAEGFDLDAVIKELDKVVPKTRARNRIDQRDSPGWSAPKKMQDRAIKRARQKKQPTKRKKAKK